MAYGDDLFTAAGDFVDPGSATSSALDFTQALSGPAFTPGPSLAPPSPSFGDRLLEGVGEVGKGLKKEFTDRPLESFAKTLGLGATGFNVANQVRAGNQMQQATAAVKQSQQQATAAAAPAVAAGTADIQHAQAGQLQPAMEASIAQWVQQAKADMRARFAQMGLGNSSDIQGEDAKIDQMALAMRGQLLQGEEALGFQGVSTGVNAAIGGGQLAQNQEKMLGDIIAQANQMLGLTTGRQPTAA